MADRPPTIDAQFRLIEDRWRIRLGDVLWYAFWVGGYALAAFAVNDRVFSAVLVCCAGLAWPVKRWLASLEHHVSPEQEAWLRSRISAPRRHPLRVPAR